VFVVCQVEVSATSRSLVQKSPTECGASLCVITKPLERGGHSPRWAAEPEKNIPLAKRIVIDVLGTKIVVSVWRLNIFEKLFLPTIPQLYIISYYYIGLCNAFLQFTPDSYFL
jgi:hypothetical protein